MNTPAVITRFASRHALKIKKNSPKILFYGGIVGTVATTVLASRATLKAVPVVQELKDERRVLEERSSINLVQPEEFQREVARQYATTGVELTKLYGPVVIIGVGSLIALTKSHQQLTSRNAALTAAYTGLFKSFEAYRERVREELDSDADQRFLHGTVTQEVEIVGKNGKIKTQEITSLDPNSNAHMTFLFNKENSKEWSKDPGYNQIYLDGQQTWMNVLLKRRGHIFLNEVLDHLGMQHTREGQVLGWVYRDLGNNDDFVVFGHNLDPEFNGGHTRDVLLQFNIHGSILEEI